MVTMAIDCVCGARLAVQRMLWPELGIAAAIHKARGYPHGTEQPRSGTRRDCLTSPGGRHALCVAVDVRSDGPAGTSGKPEGVAYNRLAAEKRLARPAGASVMHELIEGGGATLNFSARRRTP